MGVSNLCKLIEPILPPTLKPTFFDSILIDCQSYLYIAIQYSLETDEKAFFNEVCQSVYHQLDSVITPLVSYPYEDPTLILSFDGTGVPMKWATQRLRRTSQTHTRKSFYRYVLFGNNTLTAQVQRYVVSRLKKRYSIPIVLAGCNVPGEGEHKIFHVSETLSTCHHPIIVSVDQDVFILALMRIRRYQSIQIFRYGQFYRVSDTPFPYPLHRFIHISFLFGNDFIPALIGITPQNAFRIREAMEQAQGHDAETLATFLKGMQPSIRFTRVEFVDRLLMMWFWMTYFWIQDYYTTRVFPQQFLENHIYEAFDRNQLLTGLEEEAYSTEVCREAKTCYDQMKTVPIPHAETHIFTDPTLLNELKGYWIESTNEHCSIFRPTTGTRKKEKGLPPLSIESQTVRRTQVSSEKD